MNDLRGPDWRVTDRTDRRRGINPLVALLGVCAVVGVGIGLLLWVRPVRPAVVMAVSVTRSIDGSPVPFAATDFARVTDGPLSRASFAPPADPSRDQLRTALAAMSRHPNNQSLVLFLSGAVSVRDGELELAAGVPGVDHGRNRVTLADVFDQVRAVTTPHKLVVLDLHSLEADWVPIAQKCLENQPDATRQVLFARAVGERSHVSLERNGATFIRYWTEGIRGAADGWNTDGSRDGRVSVAELAAFVRTRSVRWAEQNRSIPQTPWLTGGGADFVLTSVSAPVVVEPEPLADPAKMFEAWAIQDMWLADGRADRAPSEFAQLQRALLVMERDWQAGQPPETARRNFDITLARIERDASAILTPGLPDVLLPTPSPDAGTVETLRRYLVRNEAVAEPTEKPPVVTAPVILAVASADPPPSALQLKRLAKLLADTEPEPAGWPSLLLRRVAVESVSPDRAARLLRNTLEFEQLSRRVEFFPWAAVGLERTFNLWTAAVTFTCSPGYANPSDADRTLTDLEADLRTLAFVAETHRMAVISLRRGERVLPKSDPLDRLRVSLTPPQPSPPLAETATASATWMKFAAEVDSAVRVATAPYLANELTAVRRKAEGADAGPRELADLDRLLAYPLLASKERTEVWAARLALAKRLEDATADRDRQDDEDYANRRRVPEWRDPCEVPPPRAWAPATIQPRPVPPVDLSPRGEFLTWHAGRFDYLARNPLDLPNAGAEVAFAARVVDLCRLVGVTVTPRLEIQAPEVVLTSAKRSATSSVSVRLVGADQPISAAVDVLTPSTEWVTSPIPESVTLSPVRAVIAERTLTVGTKPENHPALRGVLVRAEVGGRLYFRRLGVDASSLGHRLDLLVSTGPKSPPVAATVLPVRPNGQPVKFDLILSNPTTTEQTVIVQLFDPSREMPPVTLKAGEKRPLAFPPPAPAVPPTPAPAPAPGGEFVPAPANIVVNLLDPKTRDVRQVFTLPVRVTEPAELLDVREVQYTPGGGLKATVGERLTFGGGDMPLSLVFPEDRNPGLTVADGKLSSTFVPGQGTQTLYAKGLKFESTAGRAVTLTVSADGVERAFSFAGEAAGDTAVRFQPLTAPRVQVRCTPFATGTAPLPVKLEADNAPPAAVVEVAIGTETNGKFVADFTHKKIPAKDRSRGVAFDPKGGLTLRATVADPEPKLPVDRLVGTRMVIARLLDENGRELARDRRVVVFDGRRPQGVRFLDPPEKVPADKPLTVKATCDVPVSGVKEVHFFVGKPVNDAPPPTAVLVAGKVAEGTNEWAATVPLDGMKGPADLSVRFTSKTGLIGFATVTVERVDAAELNKPALASVTGKVFEGTLAQPGMTVTLLDDKGKEKAKAKTKDDGSFAFADLPAGKYTLFAEKTSTGREKRLAIELKPAEEKAVELKLLLK